MVTASTSPTIEPFHGNSLCLDRDHSGGWSKAWESGLDFGHCLLAGTVARAPSIIVSNRAGSRDLLMFQFEQSRRGVNRFAHPNRAVIDAGAGAANMLLVRHGGTDLIFAANQGAGEIAVYACL